ncbi:MAG TPA: family 43 glycosylhydrolase, partial [Prolixibacteraceae bacterium]|nr:family 43 glycosylhydrolase [Prolixibacteraceae bacterium]
ENIEAGSEDTPDENGFPSTAYTQVKTFINPIMPGDHPDMTLFKDGDNFYACGSNFHFVPYLPILHSTDLVHWEEICRVIPASWNGIVSDAPQAGTWAGVITYFYNSYWIYFSNTAGGGQYFCKADNPAGPWSTPVKVKTTATTGAIGYDNSIFVDDDGTPYMLIKPGQVVNRIQEVGTDGHLIGNALNLDWVNQDKKYSWAEGPVMCKHEGWYYYFVAGNVYGGQYVLRSRELTDNPESWEEMGNFFENTTDPKSTFRSPNHIAQPFELNDGTWWTISHSYESLGSDDWNGQGRQGMLHQIYWDSNGKPTGKAVTSTPQLKPNLPKSGIPWKTPRSDSFENEEIELSWHFMNRKAAKQYSLDDKTGWLTLLPGSGKTHILHKEARHHYALVTQLDFDAQTNKHEAGIYLTNGNESVTAELFSGFDNGKIIGFRFGNTLHITENEIGNNLWLKVERYGHLLSAFYSSNGISWIQVGKGINVSALDKGQENYNWWVGTSNGLYAAGAKAAFNCYAFKDGFSVLPIVGYNNYFGLETKGTGTNKAMYNSSDKGGWAMLAGVDLGSGLRVPEKIQVEAASNSGGQIEVWIDDLENQGTLIATIDITDTGGESTWQHFEAPIGEISGQHDIFIRWKGPANAFLLKSIQFIVAQDYTNATKNASLSKAIKVYPNPFEHGITVETINTNSTYQIYTLSGQMVETGTIGSSPQIIGTSLAQGLYLLKNGSEIIKINKIK